MEGPGRDFLASIDGNMSLRVLSQSRGIGGFSGGQTTPRENNEGEVINQRMMALVMKLTHPEKDRQSRQQPPLLPPSSTLYINNLNEKISTQKLEEDLKTLFGRFGNIEDFSAMKSFWRRGQAFIAFESVKEASDALAALQGRVYQGKSMRINFARRPSRRRERAIQCTEKAKLDTAPAIVVKKPHGILLREQALQDEFLQLQQDLYEYQKALVDSNEERGKRKAFSLSLARPTETKRAKTGEVAGNRTLFCDDMDPNVAEADLIATFSTHSGFERVRFIDGKRVAFVDFKNIENAAAAMQAVKSIDAFSVSFAKR